MAEIIAICNQKGGVGKCLAPETPVVLSSGKIMTIKQLFYQHYNDYSRKDCQRRDDFFIKPKEKLEVFSLNRELKLIKSKVDYLYRGKTNKLYKIKTNKGKLIKVTAEHPFLTLRNDKLIWLKAKDIEKDDFIATPRQLNFSFPQKNIELTSYLSERIFVKINDKLLIQKHLKTILLYPSDIKNKILFSLLEEKKMVAGDLYKIKNKACIFAHLQKFLKSGIIKREKNGRSYVYFLNKKKLVDYLFHRGFSIKVFQQLNWPKRIIQEFIYYNKSFHYSSPIKPIFFLDKDLAEFLAIILAEGYLGPSRIVLHNTSSNIIKKFISYCEKLGLSYKKEKRGNQWIVNVFKAGTLMKVLYDVFEVPIRGLLKSSQVKIPNKILESPKNVLATYLAAYIDCDGYIAKDRSTLEITSASQENIIRLQYAFLKFGINATIKSAIDSASNSLHPKKRVYYTLTISGSNYLKMILQFFPIKNKNKKKRLQQICYFRHNTNIDIVPVNGLLKKTRKKLGLLQKELGCQGTITDYEDNSNYISYDSLKDILLRIKKNHSIDKNNKELTFLSLLSQSDLFWERIVNIKRINYKGYVYDLTINKNHNFIAGQGAFVVHNTTTTMNLGAYLAAFGKKVLLIDFDAQSNTTSGLGFDYKKFKKTVYNLLIFNDSPQEVIYKTSVFGLHLLPTSPDLIGAQVELDYFPNKEFRLAQVLSSLKPDYDYMLIDLPPSLGVLTVNGLVAADQVLIPIQTEYYALEGLSQLITTINLIRRNLEKDLRILGAILTLYDKRNRLDRMVAKHIRRNFPGYVFRVEIPRNVSLAEAPSFGKPIIQYNPYSEGARAYRQLAQELIKKLETHDDILLM